MQSAFLSFIEALVFQTGVLICLSYEGEGYFFAGGAA